MTESDHRTLKLIFSFYEGVFREGPGSDESTLQALSLLHELPPQPRIVDFGCCFGFGFGFGSDAAAIALAKSIDCIMTAVDIDQPFLDDLQTLATNNGVDICIKAVQADTAAPPLPDQPFDRIWSEAAIGSIGFEEGLKRWRRLLPAGGQAVVSETTWLSESPPLATVAFWRKEHPAITNNENNLSKVQPAGFEPTGHFVLPTKA